MKSSQTSYQEKAVFTLTKNVKKFIEFHGSENVGFITLTFSDNVTSSQESSRRFNSFKTNYFNRVFPSWLLIRERQKRGAWHYHLLVNCGFDIKTCFDFSEFEKKNYKTIKPAIKKLWTRLRLNAKKYGFGRTEGPIPIRTTSIQLAKYMAKYLAKGFEKRKEMDKNVRLVSYSQGFIRAINYGWSWGSRSKSWRTNLKRWGYVINIGDSDQFVDLYGSNWAFNLSDYIINLKDYSDNDIKFLHRQFVDKEILFCEKICNPSHYVVDDAGFITNNLTGEQLF